MYNMELIPTLYQVDSITHETSDVFTLVLTKDGKGMCFLPGQYNMLYHFGYGESAISISGDPSIEDHLVHTIRAVGSVTQNLQKIKPGDEIGIRGPYGDGWPGVQKGQDVLIIAGGIGLAPLRPKLFQLAKERRHLGSLTLLYGARSPEDLIYSNDLQMWRESGIHVEVTVDHADLEWHGRVGVVTKRIKANVQRPENTCVYICGPEVMIRFSVHELLGVNVDKKNIFVSLERHMQCANGFCGRCQFGPYFICKDGPVFPFDRVEKWLMIKEL